MKLNKSQCDFLFVFSLAIIALGVYIFTEESTLVAVVALIAGGLCYAASLSDGRKDWFVEQIKKLAESPKESGPEKPAHKVPIDRVRLIKGIARELSILLVLGTLFGATYAYSLTLPTTNRALEPEQIKNRINKILPNWEFLADLDLDYDSARILTEEESKKLDFTDREKYARYVLFQRKGISVDPSIGGEHNGNATLDKEFSQLTNRELAVQANASIEELNSLKQQLLKNDLIVRALTYLAVFTVVTIYLLDWCWIYRTRRNAAVK